MVEVEEEESEEDANDDEDADNDDVEEDDNEVEELVAASGDEVAFVQTIRGGGKPLAIQSMLAELPRITFASAGSIDHFGATLNKEP